VILTLIAFGLPGGSMRYEADFASFLILAAGLLYLCVEPRGRALRRAFGAAGALACLFGAFVGLAVSTTGANDELRLTNPSAYESLQRATSLLPSLYVHLVGGASVIRVIDPDAGYPTALGDYGTYQAGHTFTLLADHEEIDVIAGGAGTYALAANYQKATSAPSNGAIVVHLSSEIDHTRFHFTPGQRSRLLRLRGGLNKLEAWVTFTGTQAPGAFKDILQVSDLQLSRVARS
jgi:hypothetical protein